MTDALTLPPDAVAITDARGCLTVAGRGAFSQIIRELLNRIQERDELLAAIASLDDSAAALLASKADKSLLVLGEGSIDSGATTNLSANRVFQLVNDQESPGNNYFYGTTAAGVKGWRVVALSGVSGAGLSDYADDTAAAAGGVAIGALYRTGSTLKVRIA